MKELADFCAIVGPRDGAISRPTFRTASHYNILCNEAGRVKMTRLQFSDLIDDFRERPSNYVTRPGL